VWEVDTEKNQYAVMAGGMGERGSSRKIVSRRRGRGGGSWKNKGRQSAKRSPRERAEGNISQDDKITHRLQKEVVGGHSLLGQPEEAVLL